MTFVDPASERVRFHATRSAMVQEQAAALGLELRLLAVPWTSMEARLTSLLADLRAEGYRGVVLGDIHLADVRAWYEERVTTAGLEHVEPLWGEPPQALLEEFVGSGGRAVVTCVDTSRLPASWLGRVIDREFAQAIAGTGVDACGENGEYHSFAYSGPGFQRPVRWVAGRRRTDGRFRQLDLLLSR